MYNFEKSNTIRDKINDLISGHPSIKFHSFLYDQKKLNAFFNGIDCAIWTLPTISFFEALGTGLRILIPYGDATSHLSHTNIRFFGKNGGIIPGENDINDAELIIRELIPLLTALEKDYPRIPAEEYEKDIIVKELLDEYRRIRKGAVS